MKNFKNTLVSMSFFGIIFFAQAQDCQFSNINQTQFLNNPAFSGANAKTEANVIYRNQWKNSQAKFETMAAGFSNRLGENSKKSFGKLAMGLNVIQDKSSQNSLKTSQVQVNTVYHLKIGANQQLSSGIYLGYLGMNSDSDLAWASQHNGTIYDPLLDSREENLNFQSHHIDAGFGFVHSIFQNEFAKKADIAPFLQVGAAFYHLGNSNELQRTAPTKFIASMQMNVSMLKNRFMISPQMAYFKQANFQKMQAGINFTYLNNAKTKATGNFSNSTKNSVALGLFYSLSGNLTSILSLTHKKVIFHFSYDKLIYSKKLPFVNNAFETGISYVIPSQRVVRR